MKRGNYEVLKFLMSAILLNGAADDRQLSGPLKKLPSEILNLSLQAKEFKINVSSQCFFLTARGVSTRKTPDGHGFESRCQKLFFQVQICAIALRKKMSEIFNPP